MLATTVAYFTVTFRSTELHLHSPNVLAAGTQIGMNILECLVRQTFHQQNWPAVFWRRGCLDGILPWLQIYDEWLVYDHSWKKRLYIRRPMAATARTDTYECMPHTAYNDPCGLWSAIGPAPFPEQRLWKATTPGYSFCALTVSNSMLVLLVNVCCCSVMFSRDWPGRHSSQKWHPWRWTGI